MTAIKNFSIAANGTPMGIFEGADEEAALLAYAQDAGFKDIEDAATRYLDRDVTADLDDAIAGSGLGKRGERHGLRGGHRKQAEAESNGRSGK